MTRLTLLLSLAAALPACGATDPEAAPGDGDAGPGEVIVDYSAAGPHEVGTSSAMVTGSTGVELRVQVWYPSAEAGSETVVYDNLYAGGAFTDNTPDCRESRPVLLFSHGYGGIRWQSGFLVEHLASHGYVVIAPDHTHNTFLDNDDSLFEDVLFRRPADLADSFDWAVAQSEDPTTSLAGCVEASDGYAVSGHSFGGYTAFAAAGATLDDGAGGSVLLADDRVWAAVPLAPWDAYVLQGGGTATVDVPVMCLSGTLDETTTWGSVTAMYDTLTTSPRYLGEFPTAGHYSFSPLACQTGSSGDGCGDEFVDLDVFAGVVNTAVVSFLEESRGVAGAIDQLPEHGSVRWKAVD